MYHIFITYVSVIGHLGRFYFLAIVNRAAMNMAQEASVEYDALSCQQRDCLYMSFAQMKPMIISNWMGKNTKGLNPTQRAVGK